jgi:hypothetical protein
LTVRASVGADGGADGAGTEASAEDSVRALRAALDSFARSAFVASPKNCASAALIASCVGCFDGLRLRARFLGRDRAFAGDGQMWRAAVPDGWAVLIGCSGASLTCPPAVAGCAPTVASLLMLDVTGASRFLDMGVYLVA